MAGAHHAVGQSRSVFLNVLLSPVSLQPCIELLQIVLRQFVQRYLADLGNDVIVDAVLVVLLSQRSDGRLGVVLVPELHPIAEQHIRLAPRARRSVFLFQFFKLLGTLGLGVSEDVFGDRQAFVIVADHHSAFPPSVLALP